MADTLGFIVGAGAAKNRIAELEAEVASLRSDTERLEGMVRNAAQNMDDHIDYPQVVSHAELRATAKAYRSALSPTEEDTR